jgi:hypothetical protein
MGISKVKVSGKEGAGRIAQMTPQGMAFDPPTPADLAWLRQTLGREPVGVLGIAARDGAGHPRVIVNHPLQGSAPGRLGIPQPTTFWLVDADLSAALSRLEYQGAVKAAEAWLAEDPARAARYAREHRLYAAFRWSLLSEEEKAQLAGTPQEKVLRDSGIGGMGETAVPAVKCLHLQMGWALAHPGAVLGEWLEGRL